MIYSPSYLRHDKATTHRVFPEVTYCVHEKDSENYKKQGLKTKIVPDSLIGNVARVRNWILNNTEEKIILMVDDDLTQFNWIEDGAQERECKPLNTDDLRWLIYQGMIFLSDTDFHLFGVNIQDDPRFYRKNMPFSFTLPVLGPFSLIKKNKLIRYDESLPLKEDYDFFLQNVKHFGGAIRLNPVHYKCDHQKLSGGCQQYRTKSFEKENMDRLITKWGSGCVRAIEGDFNPVIKV